MCNYRSKYEREIHETYSDLKYESEKISYIIPAVKHTYIPDFICITDKGNKIYIETKGRFTSADRKKMLLVTQQYPDLDIRIVFQNPNIRISKTSKTTVAEWCIKYNIKYGNKDSIKKWIKND